MFVMRISVSMTGIPLMQDTSKRHPGFQSGGDGVQIGGKKGQDRPVQVKIARPTSQEA